MNEELFLQCYDYFNLFFLKYDISLNDDQVKFLVSCFLKSKNSSFFKTKKMNSFIVLFLSKFLVQNKNGIFFDVFINPFQHIYYSFIDKYHLDDTESRYNKFIELCLVWRVSSYKDDFNKLEKVLYSQLLGHLHNLVIKYNRKVVDEVLFCLYRDDIHKFNCQEDLCFCENIYNSLDSACSYYYLISFLTQNKRFKLKELRFFLYSTDSQSRIERYRERFFEFFGKEYFDSLKYSDVEQYKCIENFLGLSDGVNCSKKKFYNELLTLKKKRNENDSSLFSNFLLFSRDEVLDALNTLKQISVYDWSNITLRKGDNFCENNDVISYRSYYVSLKKLEGLLYNKISNGNNLNVSIFKMYSFDEIFSFLEILKERSLIHYQVIIDRFGKTLTENNNDYDRALFDCAINRLRRIANENSKDVSTLYSVLDKYSSDKINSALEILKEFYPKKYSMLVKRHGDDFLKWHIMSQKECAKYNIAKKKLVEILEEGNKCIFCYSMTFYDKFPEYDEVFLKNQLELFKYEKLKHYQIIIKRHGTTLLEWNKLNDDDSVFYGSALRVFKNFVISSFKEPVTLFEKCSEYSQDLVLEKVGYLMDFFPESYQALIKRHGITLKEWNVLGVEDTILYNCALKKLQFHLKDAVKVVKKINLFEKLSMYPKEMILNELSSSSFNVKYYEIIVLFHGDDFLDDHPVCGKKVTYRSAIAYLKRRLDKVILLKEKENLLIEKDQGNALTLMKR